MEIFFCVSLRRQPEMPCVSLPTTSCARVGTTHRGRLVPRTVVGWYHAPWSVGTTHRGRLVPRTVVASCVTLRHHGSILRKVLLSVAWCHAAWVGRCVIIAP